ncbi:MAG: cobalamin-dependent protein [Bdellovibrionales bacterium]|nr:cobalamin-dependent protein [Bdellovibrionales bacterium]
MLKNNVRIITAASLFDGHDASINIMRRILQDMGAEVIHLGHNRSVEDVVVAALQEGAQGICISSYQGGHMEYFKFMRDLLNEAGAPYVKIFGGGGGVIVHEEKSELEAYGIDYVFHPDDGRRMGLEGMIELIVKSCDFDLLEASQKYSEAKTPEFFKANPIPHRNLGLLISSVEQSLTNSQFKPLIDSYRGWLSNFSRKSDKPPVVLGVTGTGGAGKSSLVDELIQRFLNVYPEVKIGVVCVDPSKQKTGGGLLGDRIRMNSLSRPGVFMRSMASRGSGKEISMSLPESLAALKELNFDLLIAETSGIGQGSSAILDVCDISLYVMTSEFGAQSQLEKIDMIDYASLIAINKADRRGADDAHRDVIKQYKRTRKLFHDDKPVPVHLTQASNFNDSGVNGLFFNLVELLGEKWEPKNAAELMRGTEKQTIVPVERQNYLAEIVSTLRAYKRNVEEKAEAASTLYALDLVKKNVIVNKNVKGADDYVSEQNFKTEELKLKKKFTDGEWQALTGFEDLQKRYSQKELSYSVRGKEIKQSMTKKSLSGLEIPRVSVPQISDWGDRFRYLALENVPGEFPFTAGVFPLKRQEEDPIRMFAGEGPAERTNKRFHYLSHDLPVKRLSTAFDSVTLYGHDPDLRPDIYGKVGESGVSISTLDDMKRLYAGFDLCDPKTSVSMTINGPAPMILAFFMNTAIDQQVEKKEKEIKRKLTLEERKDVEAQTISKVRGTVQADILKEDQGQNTCIFSVDFALKMMGDVQTYFIEHEIRNFYSVSISGYHIAEAGANPISQLAFTLSNAFTFVEYYRSRGLNIDDFAPNLSFFFSNGLDPEYNVIGRVARRIWAVAIRDLYHGNDRSQKLKYHIQTSGRSLHAQEIDFNDIRTTLQALIAINDNCNSLHTNAFDEAITTPTEASVRRAQAIQMVINKEFGQTQNENPMQGSYFLEWLTDQVEEAVLEEFLKINARGGVLGAMETQYQRGKIQEESLYYESLKHSGELPIVGVNTFLDPKKQAADYVPPKIEMARATPEEKKLCLDRTNQFKKDHAADAARELENLKRAALAGENIFSALMSAARHCTLYQMTHALFDAGGKYRRNI